MTASRRQDAESRTINVEQHHLRLRRLEDEIAELLDLQAGLEGQLQLRACASCRDETAATLSRDA